jgi:ABC-2 type transport system ATP-binding protein
MNAIEIRDLSKHFDKLKAVDRISFSIKKGEMFGLLGPNGAGKTTTIKMLSTILRPTGGNADVWGHDIHEEPDEVRRAIGIVFQDPAIDDYLTGEENLDFHARMYGMDKDVRKKRTMDVLKLVNLSDKAGILVKEYSGGMKRRLEIARGLMHYPKVLFLDEPTLGLDAQTRRAIWEYIKKLNREEKITIILTTHYMEEADYLCDRVAIIDRGKVLAIDTPDNLKETIGGDIISLKSSDTKKLEKIYMKEPFVKNIKMHDGHINLYVERPEKRIPRIIEMANRVKVEINSANIHRPTLEDVFLHYTGRRIREEGADLKERMREHIRMRMGGRK